jgi:H+-transporting ATPase
MASNVEKEPGPQGDSPVQQISSTPTPEPEPEKKKREYKDFGHEEEKATRESDDALCSAHAFNTLSRREC